MKRFGFAEEINDDVLLKNFKNKIETDLKSYSFETLSRNQIIYFDSLLHDLDLTRYFINEFDTLKNDYYFKAFEIPRAIISCVIQENNMVRLLESKNESLCGSVKERKNIEKHSKHNIRFLTTYKIEKCTDLFDIYRQLIIENKLHIRKCENCGKYFIPESRSDEKYCSNPSPQNPNKTCKEYGAKKKYRDEIKSHPIKYEHNKTSQFYRMRINRTKNNQEKEKYEKKFNTYKENFEKKKKQYNSGKLKENNFVEWIIKQKEGVKNGSSRTNKK